MPAVETRKGILISLLKSQLWCSLITFVLTISAFKWLYALEWGIIVLFSVAAFVCLFSGVYSYTYSQAKIDLRDKGKFDWLMPLKISATSGLLIFVPAAIHIILTVISADVGSVFGLVAKFWNYPFFWFFYGRNGDFFNYTAIICFSLAPVLVGYISYYLGIKRFSFTQKLDKVIYKK